MFRRTRLFPFLRPAEGSSLLLVLPLPFVSFLLRSAGKGCVLRSKRCTENSTVLLFTPLGCFFTPALITGGFPLGQERILSARPDSGAVRCGRSGRGWRCLQRPLQPAVPRLPERPSGAALGAPRELPGEGSRAEAEKKRRRGSSSVEELCCAV